MSKVFHGLIIAQANGEGNIFLLLGMANPTPSVIAGLTRNPLPS